MLLAWVGVAQANSCQQLADQIEKQLLLTPDDLLLQQAWQALVVCEDKPNLTSSTHQHAKFMLAVAKGYDANPAFNASLASLALTTDVGLVTIPLNNQLRSSSFNQLQGFAQWHDGAENTLYGQYKWYDDSRLHNQYLVAGDRRYNLGKHQLQLGFRWLDALGVQLRQLQIADSYELGQGWRMGPELRVRRFVNAAELDGNQWLWVSQWDNEQRTLWAKLALGLDAATGERAGANQQLAELSVGKSWNGQAHGLDVMLYGRWQQDEQGYSQLLDYNAKRSLKQYGALMQWRFPWLDEVASYAQLDYGEQQANLPLFNWQNTTAKLLLVWQW